MSEALKEPASSAAVAGREEIETARVLADGYRAALKVHVDSVVRAGNAVRTANDIASALLAFGDLALELETLSDEAGKCRQKAREWLAYTMSGTGATTLRGNAGTWSVKAKPAFVDIMDPSAVPPELMTNPQPAPDRTAISAWLKKHGDTNWARRVQPNGWTAAFTARKS